MNDGPITERGDPRDRIHNQRTLFDVDRTTTTQCPSCHEVREPDQDKVKTCPYDSFELYIGRRPKGCLNAHDPAHAPFPEGY